MPTDVSRGMVELFDDFLLTDNIDWNSSSDTGGTCAVVAAGTAHLSGRWRLVTDGTDDDMSEGPNSGLCFQVQDGGPLIVEHRLVIETGAVASVAINHGFNDDELDDSNTLPVELATVTFTSNAATFVGMVFDPDATNDDWHAFWVDDDTDSSSAIADLRFTGSTPTADEFVTLRTVLHDRGTGLGARGEFFIWDQNFSPAKFFNKVFSTSVDRDAVLCSYVSMENRAAVAHTVDVDYVYILAPRTETA